MKTKDPSPAFARLAAAIRARLVTGLSRFVIAWTLTLPALAQDDDEAARYAPGIDEKIVAREVLTPADIEARYGTTGGHIHHGEHALDQLIARPTPETARYRTPIRNLYLCGSGSFPGGGVTCAPGLLAARAIARG